ncbi:unnamed protein product [Ceutorhynchus assimilis]|uniref:HTH psq-type domain-containing protein n=1 Tax=Ceutorhynchus assimilis TaxID=467358 RepID=A0A9N9MG54_9CUCU|nr:unnamed protein product [Ceutorhynchus assimilis]
MIELLEHCQFYPAVDLTNRSLFNDSTEIPLVYRDDFNIQKIEIPPLTNVIKNINANIPDGTEIMMPQLHNYIIEISANMVRKYQRTLGVRKYKDYKEEVVEEALGKVTEDNFSIRKASVQYGIPFGTLYNRYKGLHIRSVGRPTLFTPQEELQLVKSAATCGDWGYPFSKEDMQFLAKNYLDKQGKIIPYLTENKPENEGDIGNTLIDFLKEQRFGGGPSTSTRQKKKMVKVVPGKSVTHVTADSEMFEEGTMQNETEDEAIHDEDDEQGREQFNEEEKENENCNTKSTENLESTELKIGSFVLVKMRTVNTNVDKYFILFEWGFIDFTGKTEA